MLMFPNALCIGLAAAAGLFALKQPAVGQPAAPQMDVAASVITAQTQYSASFTASPRLYNGPEYVDCAKRYHARDGHQFFVTPELQAGRYLVVVQGLAANGLAGGTSFVLEVKPVL